jgi:hypothetical protein
MKKLALMALLAPALAFGQGFPTPTFNSLTLQNPLTAANGGTGASSATGTGSVVLNNAPAIASPTVTGAFTATGLVTTADLATQAANTVLANVTGSAASPTAFAMPSCSASTSALNWTAGTGFGCNSAINAATLGGATFAAPGAIGSGTPSAGAFTTLSSTSPPTIGTGTLYPSVTNNSALTSLSTATMSAVTRLGFATAGDAPTLSYTASASACSLNSGAGDNGSQVPSANGKCWLANFPAGSIDVRQFGAKGDNATNNTTAMQAAHNTGMVVYYPAGDYLFTTLSFSAGGIVGDSIGQTIIQSSDVTGADVITYTGTGNVGTAVPSFTNFTLLGQLSKPGGVALNFVTPSGGELDYVYIENVTFENFPSDVHFKASAYFKIIGSNFINFDVVGLNIENQFNSDSGDSFISDSFFGTGRVTGSTFAIEQQSSGGLKIDNIKINGCDFGYVMAWNGPSTGILLISNSSIENFTTDGIFLSRASGTGGFGSVIINGDEFLGPNPIATDSSGFLTLVNISNNVFNILSTSGVGITLSNVSNFLIGPNLFNGASGGSPFGISTLSTSSNGKIFPQTWVAIPAANRISNGSSTVIYTEVPESGTAGTITTSTAYGSLFQGTVAVTFPQAFAVAPKVNCNSSGIGGSTG